MASLLDIECATKQLSLREREELLVFLAGSLREERASQAPAPRRIPKKEIESWIAEDEADMKSLRSDTASHNQDDERGTTKWSAEFIPPGEA